MNLFFKELFEYNHQMNQILAVFLHENTNKVSEKAIKLFSHTINAHQIWNNRIAPQQKTYDVWQIHPTLNFKSINQTNYEHSILILDNVNLSETINYVTSKGQPFSNTAQGILFHVINHSTYHRGQIATELKQSGLEPLSTDYIFYKR